MKLVFEEAPGFTTVKVKGKAYGRISLLSEGRVFHQAGLTVDPFLPLLSTDLRVLADQMDAIDAAEAKARADADAEAGIVAGVRIREYRGMPCGVHISS